MNYQWSAEPAPVSETSSRSIYRNGRPKKPQNLMHDRRVRRGATRAATNNRNQQQQQQGLSSTRKLHSQKQRRAAQQEAAAPRAVTPPPVENRKHMLVQTIDYLEDLRVQNNYETTETQTDPAMDLPTEKLFNPQPSGPSVATQITEGELFDFFQEVSPVLDVLVSKSLDQALMEVLEQDEQDEIRAHKDQFLQQRNNLRAAVTALENKAVRLKQEQALRDTEVAEEAEVEAEALVASEAAAAEYETIQTVVQTVNAVPAGLTVREDIEKNFYPWLLDAVGTELELAGSERKLVDFLLKDALAAAKAQAVEKQMELIKSKNTDSIWLRAHTWKRENLKMKREAAHGPDFTRAKQQATYAAVADDVLSVLSDNDHVVRIQALQRQKQAREHVAVMKARQQQRDPQGVADNTGVGAKIVSVLPPFLGFTVSEVLVTSGGDSKKSVKRLRVSSVASWAGAAQVSIMEGDLLSLVAGKKVYNLAKFETFKSTVLPGDMVSLQLQRGTDQREETVALEVYAFTNKYTQQEIRAMRTQVGWSASDSVILDADGAQKVLDSLKPTFGFEYGDINDRLQATLVSPTGSAARGGLLEGDQIINLLDAKALISTAQTQKRILQSEPGSMVPLVISRTVEGQTDEDEYDLLLEADAEDTAVERVRSLRRICGLPFLNSAPAPEEPLDEPLTEEEKEFQIVNVLKPSAGCTLEDSKQGVVVKHVLRAGAAAHATLVSGDVILTVNNTPVPTKKTFLDVVKQSKPGDVIRIAVKRGFDNRGETLSLELFSDDIHYPQTTVRELRQRFNLSAAITLLYDAQTASEEVAELELSIGFALGDNMQVTELVHGSTAAVAGLENGDIITHVDHQAIGTVAQFGAVLVQYLPGDFSSLRIQGKTEEVLVELAAVGKGNSVEWVRSLRSMAAQDEGESTTTEG